MEFSQVAILLVTAASVGAFAKLLKQPLLIGYLFAGFLLATFGVVSNIEVFSGLGQIGVTLLLFLVGLEMNLKELPSIGKVALMTGVGQILFTTGIGFALAFGLGFGILPAAYISIALAFSSTIIIVKLLSEKNDLDSLYGKISVGFLLVQDLVAVLILMYLAGLGRGDLSPTGYLLIGGKALLLLGAVWGLSKKVLPTLFNKYLANSQELLFISSIAWALGVASFVAGPLGFTYEIGGFLAGIALSNLPEHLEIASRTRPLRDFFLTIFFLILGTHLSIGGLGGIIVPAVIFSVFVLIGNPVIVLSILGFLGHKRRTSFLAGLTVAQISEFSLILVAMGVGLGHVSESVMAMVVVVAIVTMTISTYLILGADKVYLRLKDYLAIFEKRTPKELALIEEKELNDHVVLVGGGRTGKRLISFLNAKKWPFVLVDFNPKVFTSMTAEKVPVLFGDINDPEIADLLSLNNAKAVISTVSNLTDNLALIETLRNKKAKPTTIFTALTRGEAIKYYEAGVDYVVVPQTVAGEHMRHVLKVYGAGSERIGKMGKSHFKRLLAT